MAICSWDTTLIGDGVYELRVKVLLANGQTSATIVSNLEVRNIVQTEPTPIENTQVTAAPLRTPTHAGTREYPTATALQKNPAETNPKTLHRVLITSGLGTLFLVGIIAVIQAIHSKKK